MDARVVSLHRYPVKSMLGESVERLEIGARGCRGDRVWSVRTANGKIGSGKATRRFAAVPGLLELRAALTDGRAVITFPDGTSYDAEAPDAAEQVSRHVGQPVTLAREADVSHFDDGPISIVGLGSVRALSEARGVTVDPARFRANIVIDTTEPFIEDAWVSRHVQVGTAILAVTLTSPRCVMVDMKTADLPAQPGNLKAVGEINDTCLGVIASVVSPGAVGVGDALAVV